MHVRKTARDTYFPAASDDAFFAPTGEVTFETTTAARAFAERLNVHDGRTAQDSYGASELAAMALVHEVSHVVVEIYRERHPQTFRGLVAGLEAHVPGGLRAALAGFLRALPPPAIYASLRHAAGLDERSGTSAETFLAQGPDMLERAAVEVLLLWLVNVNPAYDKVKTLVGDADLGDTYRHIVDATKRTFAASEPLGPDGESLVEVLLEPSRRAPGSIFEQLSFIERTWGKRFGLERLPLWRKLLWARDFAAEDAAYFQRRGPGPGHAGSLPLRWSRTSAASQPKRFSPDLDWMPSVVLLAKTVYVWLDQLSRTYGRSIERLDQIPNEELDRIAHSGFTGLWLIGLFERSLASKKIKQMRGDADAVASAYSLSSYDIARELGGYPSYENLKHRAWQHGIRLAADMVPNHVGIDAEWVMNHPDWFLQAEAPPFPAYRFGGPDLSEDARAGIFIEEGYWNKTDAAVVFRRHDRRSGHDRFIYHGNDGTSMPWNDTAQLDYTKPEVRHAIIQTILHVARMFPIIRFDAAMTLAKQHYQRLWFPLPGTGGAIPSRADYAMTEEQFDAAIPVEFWREVVDTVAREAPDTLLLAEAFWMMEGYFVRSLGMHRVYNSAFMNMLKREENAQYRETIKNILDFDPEILKRFVNFMNNPDEETAIAQFGSDDKYFGVCVLMSTMPGLPMFGHGQIEGFGEKYGMEYRRAKLEERPNAWLVARHEREIFPLLKKRYLFSGVEEFDLYDFVTPEGTIDEDVYAYSNRVGDESALVLYNNKFKVARGRVHGSRPSHRDGGRGDPRTLANALRTSGDGALVRFRDMAKGLEYLRPTSDLEQGFAWELGAFKYHVLVEFQTIHATAEMPWDALARELGERGVPSLDEALLELRLRPVHTPLREALGRAHTDWLLDAWDEAKGEPTAEGFAALEERLGHIADGLAYLVEAEGGEVHEPESAREESASPAEARVAESDGENEAVKVSAPFEVAKRAATNEARQRYSVLLKSLHSDGASKDATHFGGDGQRVDGRLLLRWIHIDWFVELARTRAPEAERAELAAKWELALPLTSAFATEEGAPEAHVHAALTLMTTVLPRASLRASMAESLVDPRGQALLGVHDAGGVSWLVKERFEALARVLAERELVEGRASLALARREAEDVMRVAEREGYRAKGIATALASLQVSPGP